MGSFSVALHTQRLCGLLGTRNPGCPTLLSHNSWSLKSVDDSSKQIINTHGNKTEWSQWWTLCLFIISLLCTSVQFCIIKGEASKPVVSCYLLVSSVLLNNILAVHRLDTVQFKDMQTFTVHSLLALDDAISLTCKLETAFKYTDESCWLVCSSDHASRVKWNHFLNTDPTWRNRLVIQTATTPLPFYPRRQHRKFVHLLWPVMSCCFENLTSYKPQKV